MILTDLLLVTAAFFLAYFVRHFSESLAPLVTYLWFLPLLLLGWGAFLYSSGMYTSFRLKKTTEVLFIVYQAAYLSFFLFAGVCYALRIAHISRVFVFLVFLFTTIFLAVEKLVILKVFRHLRKKGFNYRYVLMVGTDQRARDFIKRIEENRELGLNLVGLVSLEKDEVGRSIEGYPVLGTLEQVPQIYRANTIDQALFVVPYSFLGEIERAIIYFETVGVKVNVAMDYFSERFARAKATEFFDVPFLSFETTKERLLPLAVKRFMDIVLSGIGLIILSPIFLVTAILIKLTSPGPVLFIQERGSVNGRKFRLYKFRTMSADAEQRLAELRSLNEMNGPAFKLKDDPRITKIGKILRKLSIDELPQLWNVFKGDMSLVGPRPPLLSEVEQYDDWQYRRLSMRPGITCLWQVSGRNKITDFDKWAKLDLDYIDNWSLWMDFEILLRTVPVVLLGIGAK